MDERKLKTLEAFGTPELGDVRIIFDESKLPAFGAYTGGKSTDGVTTDAERAAELVRRWNAFPRLMEALEGLLKATRKAHDIASASNDDYADDEAHFVGEWMDEAKAVIARAKTK